MEGAWRPVRTGLWPEFLRLTSRCTSSPAAEQGTWSAARQSASRSEPCSTTLTADLMARFTPCSSAPTADYVAILINTRPASCCHIAGEPGRGPRAALANSCKTRSIQVCSLKQFLPPEHHQAPWYLRRHALTWPPVLYMPGCVAICVDVISRSSLSDAAGRVCCPCPESMLDLCQLQTSDQPYWLGQM